MKLDKLAGEVNPIHRHRFHAQAHIHIAADASILHNIATGAYLSTAGHFGLLSHDLKDSIWDVPGNIHAEEFMALYEGVARVMRVLRKKRYIVPLTLYTDNQATASWLQKWSQGFNELPAWTSTHINYLRTARQNLQSWGAEIVVKQVPRDKILLQYTCHRLTRIAQQLATSHLTEARALGEANKIARSTLKRRDVF